MNGASAVPKRPEGGTGLRVLRRCTGCHGEQAGKKLLLLAWGEKNQETEVKRNLQGLSEVFCAI